MSRTSLPAGLPSPRKVRLSPPRCRLCAVASALSPPLDSLAMRTNRSYSCALLNTRERHDTTLWIGSATSARPYTRAHERDTCLVPSFHPCPAPNSIAFQTHVSLVASLLLVLLAPEASCSTSSIPALAVQRMPSVLVVYHPLSI